MWMERIAYLVLSWWCCFWAGAGILKLRDDVQTCEYQDVQVMWEMLSRSESEMINHNPKRRQRPFWRVLVWSNHGSSASFSAKHTWKENAVWCYKNNNNKDVLLLSCNLTWLLVVTTIWAHIAVACVELLQLCPNLCTIKYVSNFHFCVLNRKKWSVNWQYHFVHKWYLGTTCNQVMNSLSFFAHAHNSRDG